MNKAVSIKNVIKLVIKYNNFMKKYYVYILSNAKNGVLYIGVTNDLIRLKFSR